MKKLLVALLLIGSLSTTSSASAVGLPRVYVYYPNPVPCYRTTETHGKYLNHRVACYEVRPSTISQSEDGGGFLSGLTWSAWTTTSATGSGLEYVRCYGGSTDPNCAGGRFGYNVPASVHLSAPVSTSSGTDFAVLSTRREGGAPRTVCLPPAEAC
jgi:hypothetical protein